jgi:hypothetical protein
VLLGFAIPLASVRPISLGGVLVLGTHYLDVIEKEMCGVSFAVGLLYVGGIIWGSVLASWHRKLMATMAVPTVELAEEPPFQFENGHRGASTHSMRKARHCEHPLTDIAFIYAHSLPPLIASSFLLEQE